MTNKLDKHAGFISLIQRSEDAGDGWRKVASALERLASSRVALDPSLYETKTEDDVFYVRLSDKGKILAEYV